MVPHAKTLGTIRRGREVRVVSLGHSQQQGPVPARHTRGMGS